MPSTYSTNLALELIGTGDQAGVWGNTTNTNLGTLIEQAISGYVTQAVATGTDTTITIPNGATGVARNMYIELTGTGGTNTNLIVPSNKKLYFIFNNSTGAVTVKVSGQTGVSVPQGKKVVLVSNGTDIVNGLNYIADFGTNSFTVTNLTATSATITTLTGTSAGITTISSGSANITQLQSTSATITTLTGTSANIATLSGTTATFTSATVTNLALTSVTLSNLNIASANITTLTSSSATISTTLALSGGTANGVLYLNGSKVATSGSALTFDGTTLLQDVSASNSQANFRIKTSTTGAVSNAYFNINGTDYFRIYTSVDDTGLRNLQNTPLYFSINNVEQMRLTSTGLGIGTSSPAARLDVVTGTARWNISNDGSGNIVEQFLDSTGAAYRNLNSYALNHILYTSGSERMRLDSSGNLGIGTSSPSSKLTVAGGAVNLTSNSSNHNIYQGTGWIWTSDGTSSGTTRAGIYGNSNGTLSLFGGSTISSQVTLDSSGNLGLGVTPSAWTSDNKALQVGTYAGIESSPGGGGGIGLFGNAYEYATNAYKYLQDYYATLYRTYAGQHQWYTAPSGTAGNTITFTQAMTLDADGDLGVGETAPDSKLHVKANGRIARFAASTGTASAYLAFSNTGGNYFIGADNSAGNALLTTGGAAYGFTIVAETADPIVFGTNNTERARITAAGDLVIANTTALGKLDVGLSGASRRLVVNYDDSLITVKGSNDSSNPESLRLIGETVRFATGISGSGTERARITAGGYSKFSNDGTYYGSTGSYHEFISTSSGENILRLDNEGSPSPYGIEINFSGASPDNNTQWFLRCVDSTTTRCYIWSDGDLANHDGVYGQISDQKLKQDIVDAPSQWDDLKAVRFRKYRMKTDVEVDPNAPALLGVVAQELEQVCPGLVDEHPDMEMVEVTDEEGNVTQKQQPTGTTTKTVKSSILLMKAAVALQEAMARIEKLEAEVAALKGA